MRQHSEARIRQAAWAVGTEKKGIVFWTQVGYDFASYSFLVGLSPNSPLDHFLIGIFSSRLCIRITVRSHTFHCLRFTHFVISCPSR
jgi:hypothetical protein